MKHPANVLTVLRMVLSVGMLFLPYGISFLCVYLVAGLSDMLDGFVARKTNTQSPFGSVLDTVSDLLFCMVSILCFLPVWELSKISIGILLGTGVVKGMGMSVVALREKNVENVHSVGNKGIGFLLFLLPIFSYGVDINGWVLPVCCVVIGMQVVDTIRSVLCGKKVVG